MKEETGIPTFRGIFIFVFQSGPYFFENVSGEYKEFRKKCDLNIYSERTRTATPAETYKTY
jgi:hypothetical protein